MSAAGMAEAIFFFNDQAEIVAKLSIAPAHVLGNGSQPKLGDCLVSAREQSIERNG